MSAETIFCGKYRVIRTPVARGPAPRPPNPHPWASQMGGVPFWHLLVLKVPQSSHFLKLPFGRALVRACNDQGVVGKISDGTTEINTFWTQRAPQERSTGEFERHFALKSRTFPLIKVLKRGVFCRFFAETDPPILAKPGPQNRHTPHRPTSSDHKSQFLCYFVPKHPIWSESHHFRTFRGMFRKIANSKF